ncbi:MAG: cofactor-independent phosphoglycerate mutase [Chitinivibrionales bacterium]|nr:cofactor-independent phosphoglycerate mutase [Chitinivibrionales bacterium]
MTDTPHKFAILLGDGMSDITIPELGNKTPLEYAQTPAMDAIAQAGLVGRAKTVPNGMKPGSDVANMSLMGYDPRTYYSGRAPIEAASMGVDLGPRDVAFRCNLVYLDKGVMADYASGHIESDDAHALIEDVQKELNAKSVRLVPGVSYRHLLIINDYPDGELTCTPPHDISGKAYSDYLPQGAGDHLLREIFDKAQSVLNRSARNAQRTAQGKVPANAIWLWGQGKSVAYPSFRQRFGIDGAVISAVDLVKGIGMLAGLAVCNVPGATGYLDTNYAGKVAAAVDAYRYGDFVYLHIEAPDETSHEGSLEKKIQSIEDFDSKVVAEMVQLQKQMPDLRLIVMPDHATLLSTRTHDATPVPFAVCGPGICKDTVRVYNEQAAAHAPVFGGVDVCEQLITGTFG